MHPSCTPSRAGVGSYLNCLASAPADSSPYALPPCSYKWHAGHCCPCTCGSTTRQHLSEVFQRSTLKGSQLESCRRCNCAFHQGAFCVATAFECDEDISCSCSEHLHVMLTHSDLVSPRRLALRISHPAARKSCCWLVVRPRIVRHQPCWAGASPVCTHSAGYAGHLTRAPSRPTSTGALNGHSCRRCHAVLTLRCNENARGYIACCCVN
jgi:hypothetical protein